MALTRKMLKAMGLEDEKIDQIIEAHSETVEALKEDRDKYKTDAEKLPGVRKELDELKETAKKDEGKDPYKVKYDALKEEFETFKKDVSAKETKAGKENAYKELLKEAGVSEKRIASVLRVSDVDSIELDTDGKIKDADKLKENIKKEWSDFIVTESTTGAQTPTPPKDDKKTDLGTLSMEDYIKARKEGKT